MTRIVLMGVAGCGKTSVGRALSALTRLPYVDGDDLHPTANVEKMRHGTPLTDSDRWPWLDRCAATLASDNIILGCSSLKRAYRDRLRQASPGLHFVFLDITQPQAQARVSARAPQHFFATSLVDNQFATLESPVGEAGVLRLDALLSLTQLQTEVSQWLDTSQEPA